MAKPRKRRNPTITFQPEADVVPILEQLLREKPPAYRTRLINQSLREAATLAAERIAQAEQILRPAPPAAGRSKKRSVPSA